jgi:hypothetical protein
LISLENANTVVRVSRQNTFPMKKITHKTRIKVSRKINKEFGLNYWNIYELKRIMCSNFLMEYTSKRMGIVYFKPNCEKQLLLFGIQYSEYIL